MSTPDWPSKALSDSAPASQEKTRGGARLFHVAKWVAARMAPNGGSTLLFLLSKKAYLLSLHEGPFIVSEALSPLMVGRLFGLSWWRWGSGRAIIALQVAVRNRGRWLAVIPVLSLYRRRNVGYDRLSEVTQYGPVGSTSGSVDQMTRVSRPRLLVKLLALGSDNISGQERGSSE